MLLRIEIVEHRGSISLQKKGKETGRREFVVDNDLAKNLLPNIDSLLQEKNINPCDIVIECECQNAGFTTERIAQTVVATHQFALQQMMP